MTVCYWHLYVSPYKHGVPNWRCGVVWCSSGIIFGFCCDGGLWLGQFKCVPFSLIMAHWEAVNHHHQVLLLGSLEVWLRRVIGVGSRVCSVATCSSYTYYNVIFMSCLIMDSIYLCGQNLGYCFRWMIWWNIYNV